jgi:nicotinate-nucleotide pyrophosphorylase (carboxylating)
MPLKADEWRSARRLIRQALKEDNARHDITTRLFVSPKSSAKTVIIAKEEGVISGAPISREVFLKMDPRLCVTLNVKDGTVVKKGDVVMTITGPLAPILSSERTALNFLGHLSGVATLTHKFVKQSRPYKVPILDTRKTTPGWRLLEKYAVRCGGGVNHRYCLRDVAFIKDNHWRYRHLVSWKKAIREIKKLRKRLIVEVETEQELKEAMKLRPYVILFDNIEPQRLKKFCRKAHAMMKFKPRALLEASGGINLRNVRSYAASGIDRISCGALTHAACHLNFSLDIF